MSEAADPKRNPKKFNYTKWGFVISTSIAIAAIAAGFTVPEVRCSLGLKSDVCVVQQQEIQLITQAEAGEPLPGVKIQYISQGAPEVQYTDNNGFARVSIPSKGDVNIILTKEGYPSQSFTIDLQNEQSKTRIIRFTQSGKPEVTALSPGTAPTPTPGQTQPNSTPSSVTQPISSSAQGDATENSKTLVKTKQCPKCYLVGADLGGAELSNGDLRGANLRGVRFNGNMSGADLSGADLRGFSGGSATLRGANLSGANLEGASLRGANLRGADLSNVDLSAVDLTYADLSGAILPKGFQPPK